MTPQELSNWLGRFDQLTEEMLKEQKPQAAMVGACMLTIRGGIASLGDGDERTLRALFNVSRATSSARVAEYDALMARVPS